MSTPVKQNALDTAAGIEVKSSLEVCQRWFKKREGYAGLN